VAFYFNMADASTPPPAAYAASPVTPINLILFSLFALLVYFRLKPSATQTLPRAPPPTVFRTFTPPTLFPYNGLNGMPVYLAVRGRVFDVTKGRNFYGPGGPYANFAGRDASRGLAKGSFDEDMLTKDLDGPLDTLSDLGPDELEALQGWEDRLDLFQSVIENIVAVDGMLSNGDKHCTLANHLNTPPNKNQVAPTIPPFELFLANKAAVFFGDCEVGR